MEALCRAIVPDGKGKDLPLPADGVAMEGEMLAPVSVGYLRALAVCPCSPNGDSQAMGPSAQRPSR